MARIKPLRIRLSDDERAALDAEAERHHLPTATWARMALMSMVAVSSRTPILLRPASTAYLTAAGEDLDREADQLGVPPRQPGEADSDLRQRICDKYAAWRREG